MACKYPEKHAEANTALYTPCTSTDVQAHNFYNSLASYSYNTKYNYTYIS